jgi:prevent-host-death family protein
MTYTLSMAADQGIQIAADDVAEVSMTEARANLTRLIRKVREDGKPGAFTERGERRAYVVTPAFYEHGRSVTKLELELLRTLRDRMNELVNDPELAERLEQLDPNLRLLLDTGGFGY